MKVPDLSKQYLKLTAQERFQLILAAGQRGDDAERDRLNKAGKKIKLSMPDHSPFAHAFTEISHLTYMELTEEAARYIEAWHYPREPLEEPASGTDEEDIDAETSLPEEMDAETSKKRDSWQRDLDLALAAGYVLRTKAEGWQLFCSRLNVPHAVLWEFLPGYERLQRALKMTKQAAFVSEGFLRFLNDIRPKGSPPATEQPLTPERIAEEIKGMFKERVRWWGGTMVEQFDHSKG